jgi:release factor glutamine methyltransferase
MWLIRPPGVYPPQNDTWMLAKALAGAGIRPGAAVLDIGCGTGALSVMAARTEPRSVTSVDVSRRAAAATRFNTRVRGVRGEVLCGDAFELLAGRTFDLVLANPPYVPGRGGRPRGRPPPREAGVEGRALLDRLCVNAPLLLAPGGTMLIVHSGLCDEEKTLAQLRGGGLKAAVVARADEPFGPVMRGRRQRLVDLGLIASDATTEELVVIRGDRAANP